MGCTLVRGGFDDEDIWHICGLSHAKKWHGHHVHTYMYCLGRIVLFGEDVYVYNDVHDSCLEV